MALHNQCLPMLLNMVVCSYMGRRYFKYGKVTMFECVIINSWHSHISCFLHIYESVVTHCGECTLVDYM